jgi:hypothetical protein
MISATLRLENRYDTDSGWYSFVVLLAVLVRTIPKWSALLSTRPRRWPNRKQRQSASFADVQQQQQLVLQVQYPSAVVFRLIRETPSPSRKPTWGPRGRAAQLAAMTAAVDTTVFSRLWLDRRSGVSWSQMTVGRIVFIHRSVRETRWPAGRRQCTHGCHRLRDTPWIDDETSDNNDNYDSDNKE